MSIFTKALRSYVKAISVMLILFFCIAVYLALARGWHFLLSDDMRKFVVRYVSLLILLLPVSLGGVWLQSIFERKLESQKEP